MFKPLISVIIPSYNHKEFIEKTIKSVINQSYENIELIVIDDGSKDGSNELISKLKQEFNFYYIHRKNKGLIKTLNEALSLAKGDYISMLGSDDYFYETKIEKQVSFFEQNRDFALCYSNLTYIDKDDKIIKEGKTKHFKTGFVFSDLINKNFIPLPTVMISADVIREAGGFDERFFLEDYPLWLKISQKYKIGFLLESLTYYRLHDNNVSNNLFKMIKEVEKILNDYNHLKEYKKSISKQYLRWFSDLLKTDLKAETKEYMDKALPSSWYKPRFIKNYIKYFLKYK
jgi:alpha-1,3-rhamnosyltransferase